MNIRPMRGRKIELPEPAMRNLQLLARLEHLTPERLLEQLIFAFLEIRSDQADDIERSINKIERSILPAVNEARIPSGEPDSPASDPSPSRRSAARVIDLESGRARRMPRNDRRPTQRLGSEKAAAAWARARQAVTDASLGRKIAGRIELAAHP